MAFDIINTATVLVYDYYSGGRPKTGGPISDDAVNPYVIPSVNLDKVCSVVGHDTSNGADLNEDIKLLYKVTNNSGAAINYNEITIKDAILVSPYISIIAGTETGGTHTGDTITISPAGGLDPGESATYEIHIKVTGPSAPTNVLATTAVATFKTATGKTNLDESTCGLNYNHAELVIEKDNNPSTPVTYDKQIQYTITITNIGNVSATIDIGKFEDFIPSYTEYVSIDEDAGGYFEYQAGPPAAIRNKALITVKPGVGNKITLKFTVNTLVQTV